jgi:hypothetical protein
MSLPLPRASARRRATETPTPAVRGNPIHRRFLQSTREREKERKKRVSRLVSHPSTVRPRRRYPYPYSSRASFNSEPPAEKPEKIMHPIPNPPRVAHLASRVSHPREPTRKKFPSTRFPSVPRHPRVARRHTARTLNSDRRRDVSRGMNPIHSVHVLTNRERASAHHSGWMVSKEYIRACMRSRRVVDGTHLRAPSARGVAPSHLLFCVSDLGESYCGDFFTKCH